MCSALVPCIAGPQFDVEAQIPHCILLVMGSSFLALPRRAERLQKTQGIIVVPLTCSVIYPAVALRSNWCYRRNPYCPIRLGQPISFSHQLSFVRPIQASVLRMNLACEYYNHLAHALPQWPPSMDALLRLKVHFEIEQSVARPTILLSSDPTPSGDPN